MFLFCVLLYYVYYFIIHRKIWMWKTFSKLSEKVIFYCWGKLAKKVERYLSFVWNYHLLHDKYKYSTLKILFLKILEHEPVFFFVFFFLAINPHIWKGKFTWSKLYQCFWIVYPTLTFYKGAYMKTWWRGQKLLSSYDQCQEGIRLN